MLRKYSNSRTLSDNIKLGAMGAMVAGMINLASLLIFISFSSNVTGYFAILASEIAAGNLSQVILVSFWIFLYFLGSFTSNFMITNLFHKNQYLSHLLPVILEMICILIVGIYCNSYYQETLVESEIMLSLLLFAMGLQNGLTTSISNFQVKTTHLTGAITDLGVLSSMLLQKRFRNNKNLVDKAKLIAVILVSYVAGAVIYAYFYQFIQYKMFYFVIALLTVMITYDLYNIWLLKYRIVRHKRKLEVEMAY